MTYRLIDGIQFLKSLPDKSVDGIFTDPPWYKKSGRHGKFELKNADQWLELIKQTTDQAARILKSNGRCLIWLGITHVGPVCKIVTALEYRWMIFVRYVPPKYVANFECYFDPIIYFAPFGSPWPKKTIEGKNKPGEYFKYRTGKKDTNHPCPRPQRNVRQILSHWFYPGEYIIDPFAGSDTTGYAARELDLRWDSCEIDSEMYKTGIERHRQNGLFEKD